MKKKPIVSIILLFCLSQSSFSQKFHFQNYSLREGLPNSSVYSILQDSRGFMWFGTDGGGVTRTDGVSFEVYNKGTGLSGNVVRAIYEDREKRIWIGTDHGLDCYDGDKINEIGLNSPLDDAFVLSITEDTAGTILIGTLNDGLILLKLGNDTTVTSISFEQGLINSLVLDIEVDWKNRYWLSLVGGINVLTFEDGTFDIIELDRRLHLPANVITCSSQDPFGNMWFGTEDRGIFQIINENNFTPRVAVVPESMKFLENETIWGIQWSDTSTCWVATGNMGLLQFKDGKLNRSITRENGLPSNEIFKILEDDYGSIWLATIGNGVLRYNGDSFKKYDLNKSRTGIDVYGIIERTPGAMQVATDEGLYMVQIQNNHEITTTKERISGFPSKSSVSSIVKDYSENIWIGTSHGLYEIMGSSATLSPYNKGLSSQRIKVLFADQQNRLWVGTNAGYNLCVGEEVFLMNEETGIINNEVQTIIQDKFQKIWIGTLGGLVCVSDKYRSFNEEEGLLDLQVYSLLEDAKSNIWIGTFGGGIYILNQNTDSDTIRQVPGNNLLSSRNIFSMLWEDSQTLIAGTESGFDKITIHNDSITNVIHFDSEDGFCEGSNNINASIRSSNGLIWFGTSNSLVSYDPNETLKETVEPIAYITDLKLNFEKQDWTLEHQTSKWFPLPLDLVLPYHQNHLTFDFTAIGFANPKDIEFSYFLEGQSKAWSPYSHERVITFQELKAGEYRLRLKAKTKFGVESQETTFDFKINPPYWLRVWFIISMVILLIFIIFMIVKIRVKNLENEKLKLKRTVELRTWEITQQKEQIEEQRDILARQQEEITDSIEYARHIQQAILPGASYLNESVKDSFILLLPQHIVSGDFYWVGKYESHLVLIAADCTGHGVPGAFMSMLGISFLNKIVNEKGIVSPGLILNALRANILNVFNPSRDAADQRSKDGMDLALCSLDLENKKLYFAGAMNPLYQINQNHEGKYQLIEHEPDKMPVGNHHFMNSFNEKEIQINEGDTFYMFSDGFSDQFGGPKSKKFMKKRFKNMLLSNQSKTMKEQKEIYHKILIDWISQNPKKDRDYPQTDDILIMGVRL